VADGLTIEELTGQKTLLDSLFAAIESSPETVQIVTGPSGSGKSWVLGALCDLWRASGHPAIQLPADAQHATRSLFPFSMAVSRIVTGLDDARRIKTAVAKLGAVAPAAGGLITYLIEFIASSPERHQSEASRFLSNDEREILFQLQSLAGDDALLLAGDNLQFFDPASIRLLAALRDADLLQTYPFLRKVRIVCAQTEHAAMDPATAAVLDPLKKDSQRLARPDPAQIVHILRLLGVGVELPPEVIQFCIAVSGGHLEVLRQIAAYIGDDAERSRRLSGDRDNDEALYFMFQERVRGLGEEGRRILDVLELLAVAGVAISDVELNCLLTDSYAHLVGSVVRAVELQMLRRGIEQRSFPHEIVQRLFLRRVEQRQPEVHEKFARCIGRLRPGDYASRAYHYAAAGNEREAALMRFLDHLLRLRNGAILLSAELERICTSVDVETAAFLRGISDAWNLFRAGEPERCRSLLERMSDAVPPVLIAEKDYLFARCVKTHGTPDDRAFITEILKRWRDEDPIEFEQWFRLMSILTVMQADAGDFVAARYTSRIVAGHLVRRAAFDPFAEAARHIVGRRDAAIFNAEIAAERCRAAVAFFRGPDAGAPRNPMQLYLARTNLGANLLMLGEFAEAERVSTEAMSMSGNVTVARYPRRHIPANNAILAAYRDGSMTAVVARDALDQMVAATSQPSDLVLLRNNTAILRALTGDLSRAAEELASVASSVASDGYYRYFVQANLISMAHLLGQAADAKQQWLTLGERIPQIPDPDRIALRKRHELLAGAFDTVTSGDPSDWWHFVSHIAPPQVGPVWRFYGYGFLLSDIQFWSEA
jgi:hypothetical protein